MNRATRNRSHHRSASHTSAGKERRQFEKTHDHNPLTGLRNLLNGSVDLDHTYQDWRRAPTAYGTLLAGEAAIELAMSAADTAIGSIYFDRAHEHFVKCAAMKRDSRGVTGLDTRAKATTLDTTLPIYRFLSIGAIPDQDTATKVYADLVNLAQSLVRSCFGGEVPDSNERIRLKGLVGKLSVFTLLDRHSISSRQIGDDSTKITPAFSTLLQRNPHSGSNRSWSITVFAQNPSQTAYVSHRLKTSLSESVPTLDNAPVDQGITRVSIGQDLAILAGERFVAAHIINEAYHELEMGVGDRPTESLEVRTSQLLELMAPLAA